MGAPKIYDTAHKLELAVDRYFKSISRMVQLTERVETGKLDDHGHKVYKDEPVVNQLGKQVEILEYVVPPTIGDLCDFLGIHRSTWDNYANQDEYKAVTAAAKAKIRTYLDRELLTRKDVKGVTFDLEANHGIKRQQTVELNGGGVEAFLERLAQQGQGAQEF